VSSTVDPGELGFAHTIGRHVGERAAVGHGGVRMPEVVVEAMNRRDWRTHGQQALRIHWHCKERVGIRVD